MMPILVFSSMPQSSDICFASLLFVCQGKCQVTVDVALQVCFFNRIFFFMEDAAYNLTFKTGDMPYAGTDANVTLQLFGDKGQTEKIMLRQESGKTLKRFDRGRTDRFTVQTMDVGKVSKIIVYLTSDFFFVRH